MPGQGRHRGRVESRQGCRNRKQGNVGNVFDQGFMQVVQKKLDLVTSRNPVCKTCNHDPLNRMTQELRAQTNGSITAQEVDNIEAFISKAIDDCNDSIESLMQGVETVAAE